MIRPIVLKLLFSVMCLCVLASNLWTMRTWTERTGVYDDICYLRQAHLFQRFGLGGFDTNITRDDDRYFATLAREIGYEAWSDPTRAPCHTPIGEKHVIQYPPGTGLALSIFPAGFQRAPLYAVANLVIFLAAILAIWSAASRSAIAGSAIVGAATIYVMINPAKASSSMAPTMIVCVVIGLLTTILAGAPKRSQRIAAATLTGLILGFAVSFRLPNLFLSVGYFTVLFAASVLSQKSDDVLRFLSFGVAYAIGLLPTLVANAINAGSPFSTTYSSVDAAPRDFSFSIVREYIADMQGWLIILAITWAAVALAYNRRKTAAAIVAVNLVSNLAFFLSHPIATPYYLMPTAMLSIWVLLFSFLNEPSETSPLARKSAMVAVSN